MRDAQDVIGKRTSTTRLHHTVTIRDENSTAALDVLSRFASNPRWLILKYAPCFPIMADAYLFCDDQTPWRVDK